jgi:Ca2+/Na+ antiporter
MVLCLETLGHAWHINDAIMGLTASAAGTAIPNYIASHVTATQGLSNMAISNAIGSNTFNILICLGLPWVILTSVQGAIHDSHD